MICPKCCLPDHSVIRKIDRLGAKGWPQREHPKAGLVIVDRAVRISTFRPGYQMKESGLEHGITSATFLHHSRDFTDHSCSIGLLTGRPHVSSYLDRYRRRPDNPSFHPTLGTRYLESYGTGSYMPDLKPAMIVSHRIAMSLDRIHHHFEMS